MYLHGEIGCVNGLKTQKHRNVIGQEFLLMICSSWGREREKMKASTAGCGQF